MRTAMVHKTINETIARHALHCVHSVGVEGRGRDEVGGARSGYISGNAIVPDPGSLSWEKAVLTSSLVIDVTR